MGQKEYPRNWLPLDVDHFEQDTIQDLLAECGPAGSVVFLVILLAAKKHATAGTAIERQGTVTLRYASVARRAAVDPKQVRKIVDVCIRLGLLVGVGGESDERFTVRLAKWDLWEPKDSGGAVRSKRWRDNKQRVTRDEKREEEKREREDADDSDALPF